ncbi:hypothetical protein H4R99_004496 [Coemansia sp. RSA 1722]|nr:hypothetical protein IWW45_003073 [Coemansia sp. RSA 485]KAJ2597460.1 hypothetical protein H4R99_004496 [Coemansia sp. RSA 1722]
MKQRTLLLFLFPILQALLTTVFAHNSIIYPCPRFSEAGIDCPDKLPEGEKLTDEENYPIYSKEDGILEPLCKYTTPWPGTKVRWSPGQEVTVQFNSWSVSHSGGHCQFSISYDNGKTFAVIHEELQYCFVGSKPKDYTEEVSIYDYTFTLPDLPASDTAVFVWTWVAAVGNREFFMNCADIIIENSEFESYTGKNITIANYPGYPTIPEFEMDYDTGLEYYRAPYIQNSTVSPGGSSTTKQQNGSSSVVSSKSLSETTKPTEDPNDKANGKAINNGESDNKNQSASSSVAEEVVEEEEEEKCDDDFSPTDKDVVASSTDDNNEAKGKGKADDSGQSKGDSNGDGNGNGDSDGDGDFVCDTGDTEGQTDDGNEGDGDDDYVCDDEDESSTDGEDKPTKTDSDQQQPSASPVVGNGEPDIDCDDDSDNEFEDTRDVVDILNSIASDHGLTIDILGDEASDSSSELPSPTSEDPLLTSDDIISTSSSLSFVLFEYSSPHPTDGNPDIATSETIQVASSAISSQNTSVLNILSVVSVA